MYELPFLSPPRFRTQQMSHKAWQTHSPSNNHNFWAFFLSKLWVWIYIFLALWIYTFSGKFSQEILSLQPSPKGLLTATIFLLWHSLNTWFGLSMEITLYRVPFNITTKVIWNLNLLLHPHRLLMLWKLSIEHFLTISNSVWCDQCSIFGPETTILHWNLTKVRISNPLS